MNIRYFQRLETPNCIDSKHILMPVTGSNSALKFNYLLTETSYIRAVICLIYHDNPINPEYFLCNQAKYTVIPST